MFYSTVAHLRVFGSDVYAHILKEERGKLDPKAKKCIPCAMGKKRRDIDSSILYVGRFSSAGKWCSTKMGVGGQRWKTKIVT